MLKVNVAKLKPGKEFHLPEYTQLDHSNYFEVEGGDNGIVLCIKADNDSYIEILPGNSVFSGTSKRIPVYYEGENYIYLESGRYVKHNSDGTNTIHLLCDAEEGIHCNVIQLI